MWLVGGAKTNIRRIDGGRVAQRHCEECDKVVAFHECEVTDKVHAFFVELLETKHRRMVCGECGEDRDVDEFFAELRALERRVPRAPARPASAISGRAAAPPRPADPDVDEMLAALKRKMNKP